MAFRREGWGPPFRSTAPFSVTGVHWRIDQGTAAGGEGWLGASQFNYTIGYPAAFSPGGTISLLWSFANHDTSAHSIISAIPNAPFTYVSSSPTLSTGIVPGELSTLPFGRGHCKEPGSGTLANRKVH